MQNKLLIFLLSPFLFLLASCDVVEPIKTEGVMSILGIFTASEEQIELSGGLIEYKLHRDKEKGAYHKFKLTDLPIELIYDTIQVYISSTEKVNVVFSIDSGDAENSEGKEIPQAGTYYFTDLDPADAKFPSESALFGLMVSRGGGNSTMNKFGIDGTVVLSGMYPDFKVQGEFIMEGGSSVTFFAEGQFVTQENYMTFPISTK